MELLYSDDLIIAINKPAGMLTILDGYDKSLPNLKSILGNEYEKIWTVHRLDKDTSGVVLFALTAACHKSLSIQFEKRQIKKIYLALIQGTPMKDVFDIDIPLKVDGDRRHRTVPDRVSGKSALTSIRILKRLENLTLIEALPATGYTHQIRAHLYYYGFPIVNDVLYSDAKISPQLDILQGRLMLHARSISFLHPSLNKIFTIETPPPSDFQSFAIN